MSASDGFVLLRFGWIAFLVLVVLVALIGVLRWRRDSYFYVSALILVMLGGNLWWSYLQMQPARAFIAAAEAERAVLATRPAWQFDSAAITSFHLDTPDDFAARQGPLRCPPPQVYCAATWMLADPASGVAMYSGRDSRNRVTLVADDPSCLDDKPVSSTYNPDLLSRGICLKTNPAPAAQPAYRLRFEDSRVPGLRGHSSVTTFTLYDRDNRVIDRVVQVDAPLPSGLRYGLMLSPQQSSISRHLRDYDQGPIHKVIAWLELGGQATIKESTKHRVDFIDAHPPGDDTLRAGINTPWIAHKAARLACERVETLDARLRADLRSFLDRARDNGSSLDLIKTCDV